MAGHAAHQDPITALHRWAHGVQIALAATLALAIAGVLLLQVL